MGAERVINNGTMVVDFELNKKPFKVIPAWRARRSRTARNGDLLISLEYSNGGSNPIVTLYRSPTSRPSPAGQTNRLRQGHRRADMLDAVRSATNFVDARPASGFGYTIPALRLRRGVDRPLRRSTSITAAPASRSGHMRSRTGGDPAELAAQGHGPAVRHRPQQLRQGHDRQERRPERRRRTSTSPRPTDVRGPLHASGRRRPIATLDNTKVFTTVPPGDYTVTGQP